eukprot:s108_g12.t1
MRWGCTCSRSSTAGAGDSDCVCAKDDAEFVQVVAEYAARAQRVLVLDDASHFKEDVIRNFELLAPFVTPGSFYVVSDTRLDRLCETVKRLGYPLANGFNPGEKVQCDYYIDNGPASAVAELFSSSTLARERFIIDRQAESTILGATPGGWLRALEHQNGKSPHRGLGHVHLHIIRALNPQKLWAWMAGALCRSPLRRFDREISAVSSHPLSAWEREWCLLSHNFLAFFPSRADFAVRRCLLVAAIQELRMQPDGRTLRLSLAGESKEDYLSAVLSHELVLRTPSESIETWAVEIGRRMDRLSAHGHHLIPCVSFADAKHWTQDLGAKMQEQEEELCAQVEDESFGQRLQAAAALLRSALLRSRGRALREAFTELALHSRLEALCSFQCGAAAARLARALLAPQQRQRQESAMHSFFLQCSRQKAAALREERRSAADLKDAASFYESASQLDLAVRRCTAVKLLALALRKHRQLQITHAMSRWSQAVATTLTSEVVTLRGLAENVNRQLSEHCRTASARISTWRLVVHITPICIICSELPFAYNRLPVAGLANSGLEPLLPQRAGDLAQASALELEKVDQEERFQDVSCLLLRSCLSGGTQAATAALQKVSLRVPLATASSLVSALLSFATEEDSRALHLAPLAAALAPRACQDPGTVQRGSALRQVLARTGDSAARESWAKVLEILCAGPVGEGGPTSVPWHLPSEWFEEELQMFWPRAFASTSLQPLANSAETPNGVGPEPLRVDLYADPAAKAAQDPGAPGDAVVAALPAGRRVEALMSSAKAEALETSLPSLHGAWDDDARASAAVLLRPTPDGLASWPVPVLAPVLADLVRHGASGWREQFESLPRDSSLLSGLWASLCRADAEAAAGFWPWAISELVIPSLGSSEETPLRRRFASAAANLIASTLLSDLKAVTAELDLSLLLGEEPHATTPAAIRLLAFKEAKLAPLVLSLLEASETLAEEAAVAWLRLALDFREIATLKEGEAARLLVESHLARIAVEFQPTFSRWQSAAESRDHEFDVASVVVASVLTEEVTKPLPPHWQGPYSPDRAKQWMCDLIDEPMTTLLFAVAKD